MGGGGGSDFGGGFGGYGYGGGGLVEVMVEAAAVDDLVMMN